MATTEPHKIPPTIISRAQRFDFKAISLDQIVERLKFVADAQQIECEDEALAFIAKASEGGMRDALSITSGYCFRRWHIDITRCPKCYG